MLDIKRNKIEWVIILLNKSVKDRTQTKLEKRKVRKTMKMKKNAIMASHGMTSYVITVTLLMGMITFATLRVPMRQQNAYSPTPTLKWLRVQKSNGVTCTT